VKYLCKDCWIAHNPSTLLARCNVCDANAHIRRLDPMQSLAATTEPAPGERPELVCRRHRSEALDVFCGECRRPLSPRSLLNDHSVIAVVGATGSGKTSLLWALRQRLRDPIGLPLQIRQSLGDSDELLDQAVRDLLISGQARPTPRQDAVTRNYAWELITTVQRPRRSALVAFHDAAGEVWNDLDGLPREEYERLFRYLDLIGSMIFLIDGERLAETLAGPQDGRLRARTQETEAQEIAIVDAIERRLGSRRSETSVAVTISKADVLWGDPRWSAFRAGDEQKTSGVSSAARALLEAAGRGAIVNAFDQVFGAVGYFAVSSFGRRVMSGEPLSPGTIQPSRIEEPLLALIAEEVADGVA
jgi:energy-coupling factor transporter ATP-binding protein EcfA2